MKAIALKNDLIIFSLNGLKSDEGEYNSDQPTTTI